MADHRKFFRPRRLAFGGRLLPCACFLALFPSLFSLAHAEDAGLKNGAASLAAGKYDNAVRQLSSTINADNAAPGEAAKALYFRGIAYRKLNQPSRAIADLGAAIWLGLSDADRVKALVNRGLAFQSAGLAREGEAEIAQARKLGGSGPVNQLVAEGGGSAEGAAAIAAFATEVRPEAQGPTTRTADASSQWTATPAPAAKAPQDSAPSSWSTSISGAEPKPSSSGNRLTRWFGSVTDSSDSSSAGAAAPAPPSAPAAPAPAPAAPRTAPQPMPAASSWAAKTETQTADSGSGGGGGSRWSRLFSSSKSAEAESPAAAPAAAPAATGGGFRLQLATSRSEQEANALWKKVSSENQVVAGAQPEIERVDIGNFGTFYSLKIGPFPDKAESLKVCNALKRNGVDCSLAEAQ